GDHLLYRGDDRPERGPWDAWTTLSALAAETERVHLGPLVACAAFHPPGILARMAATIDEISGGRFVLGIGAGWNRAEFDAFGIEYDRRASRFEEAFDVIRRLLDGERVTAQGRFHRVEDAVLLPTPARRVPLMVGSNGDRLLRAALPHVDAWNTWFEDYGNTPEGFAALNDRVSARARDVERDPAEVTRSACALVVLDGEARERLVPDNVSPIQGSASAMADRLRALADAGADEVILVVSPITERSIRSFGEVLAPLR
ncbi:MAG TPA: LLM class flavin-dependent oxidoreductase, partial [Actinomycetota bacterium]|nr:LLM class flavin-dependent oxidoreductase [Actinomycetota bacterium]